MPSNSTTHSPITATLAILAVAALCAATGYFLAKTFIVKATPEQPPLIPVTLRLNWIHQPLFMGYYVAKEKGFYADEGLDLMFKEYTDGFDQTDDVARGGSDFTLSSSFEILSAVNDGKDVKAVAAIFQQLPEAYASLRSDNIKSPADFEGKTLGIKVGNKSTGIVYRSIMQRYGLQPSDVTFKDLDYSLNVAGDLTQGRADVVHLYRNDEAYTLRKEGIEYDLILPEMFGARAYGDVLTTSGALIRRDPELVRKFVAASVRGWEYAMSHETEALAISRTYEDDRYKDDAYETFIFNNSVSLIVPTGGEHIGYMNFATWKDTANMMMQAGAIRGDLAITDAYTTQFLIE